MLRVGFVEFFSNPLKERSINSSTFPYPNIRKTLHTLHLFQFLTFKAFKVRELNTVDFACGLIVWCRVR